MRPVENSQGEEDRNARAYGWEIGRGQSLRSVVNASPDNPFLDPNWRSKVYPLVETGDMGIEQSKDDYVQVPLVIYDKKGERHVIGEATIKADEIIGVIKGPEGEALVADLFGSQMYHFSIGPVPSDSGTATLFGDTNG